MRKVFYSLSGILFLTLFSFSLAAEEVNVSGEWVLTMETMRGPMSQNMKFEQDGEKLKVTMTGWRGNEIQGDGTVKGHEIEWTIVRKTPRGEMKTTYKGKIEDDKISGEVQFGRFEPAKWQAVRKENENQE